MRTYLKPTLTAFILLLQLFKSTIAQIDVLSQQLDKHNQQVVQEKVFVHLDRPLYLVGETIWFKTFCVDTKTNHPLEMSKVAYLDVLDKEHNSVLQTKISLEKGRGFGSLFIPPFLASGHYSIRSYTNWMKNLGPDFFFETAITIVNPFSKPTLHPLPTTTVAYDLQLFPEGGNLVKGIETKIAFKATAQDGKGFVFKGAIVNQQNDTVGRFEPLKFGIGSFMFTPAAENQYRVLLQDAQKHWFSYKMPPIYDQGHTLQVQDSSASFLKVIVSATPNTPSEVAILVHTKAMPKIAEKGMLQNGKMAFIIPKNKLDDGITTITLFDNHLNPVCERLYFKRPTSTLTIAAQTDKAQYAPRQKVVLDISTLQGTVPAVADLSISVYLTDSLPAFDATLIESYLHLSSDLNGTVESPTYYFNNTDEKADKALDNLMLTHGWRRFKWKEVTNKTTLKYNHVPEIEGHLLYGKVINTKTNLPAPHIDTYLAAPSKRPQLFVATSDSLGNVYYELKHFLGAKEVIVQTDTRIDSIYRIEMASPFSEKIRTFSLPHFSFDASWKQSLLTRSINMQARNAFLPKSAQQFNTTEMDTLGFYGIPDEKYFLDAYTRFPTVEEVMREYVPGVAVRKRQGKYIFRVYDKLQANLPFEEEPLVLLDGVPVFDTGKILAFDPLKIRKLEVIDGLYYFGPMAFSGLVSYTTYKGDLGGLPLDPRALVLSYEGVQGKKEFYAPRYDTPELQKSRVPDFRNLLHWSPQLLTDSQGKQSLNFYTSDQTGTYRVVVQGLTDNGVAGNKTFSFEVKKASL
ncbi:MAG: hypothetical protein R2822_00515 [Spirosomataceae bacterium]